MSSGDAKAFDDLRSFDKASLTYVPFQTHADAMLASLQLFHDVPCQTMNLIISMVTHPEFDLRCITLRSSRDVIQVVEEARLRERATVVQKISLNAEAVLLSNLSSGYSPRLESLSISDVYPGEFDSMVTETKFTPRQCATMFEHLCTLRVSSPVADRWIKWITPHCTYLKHVTIQTMFSSPPGITSSMPATIQSLNLQLYRLSKERIRDFTLSDEWAVVLLELPSSGRVPGLKSLALSFPHSDKEVRRLGLQEEIQNYKASMKTFVNRMSNICGVAGIRFSYDIEERK